MSDATDVFNSTIAATNSNLSRLSKTVTSTASTLISSSNDLPNHYQRAMTELARQPQFQKRLFSMKNRAPSELVKSMRKTDIQYRAVTTIPEELLKDLPPTSSQFSLFQGFEATSMTRSGRKPLQIASTSQEKPTRKQLNDDQEAVTHRLDLLEIRKDLAANEIKEIDQRIEHLNNMRQIVFERVAKLEQEEFQLESELRQVTSKLTDLDIEEDEQEDKESVEKSLEENSEVSPEITANATGSEENSFLSQSIYGKLQDTAQSNKQKKKMKRRTSHSSRRKTMPTLQQFYTPGKNIRNIDAHQDCITAIDFDIPFGTMVSASLDDTVKVWDLSRGEAIMSLEGHNASVKCLQLEDNYVLTGSADATLRLWDLNNDEEPCVDVYEAHLGEITALHFYDNIMVSGSADKTIRQWDMQTGKCLQTLDVLWASAQVPSQRYDEDMKWRRQTVVGGNAGSDFVGALQSYDAALASGTADGVVRLWDLRSGQVHRTLIGHTGGVTSLQFDEHHLVTGSLDRSIRIWDLRMGSIFDAFAYDHAITSLHFDSRRVVSADCENSVKIYDRESEKHWSCGAGVEDSTASIVERVRYREGYLIEGRRDGQIGIWAC